MRLRAMVLTFGGLSLLPFSWEPTRGDQGPLFKLPPLEASYPLPPLPVHSARNANYTIEARLLPAAHTIEGRLVLEWRNTSDSTLATFPFHLYWNAFRNNVSTSARGQGRRAARPGPESEGDRSPPPPVAKDAGRPARVRNRRATAASATSRSAPSASWASTRRTSPRASTTSSPTTGTPRTGR